MKMCFFLKRHVLAGSAEISQVLVAFSKDNPRKSLVFQVHFVNDYGVLLKRHVLAGSAGIFHANLGFSKDNP